MSHTLISFDTKNHDNIEPQIWCKILQKTTKNSKFKHGNFSNKSVDQERHFKYAIRVEAG